MCGLTGTDLSPDCASLPDEVKQWMQEYMPNAQQHLSSSRVKIIIGIICKTLSHRFDAEFCFGFSEDSHVKAAAKLAKLQREFHFFRCDVLR